MKKFIVLTALLVSHMGLVTYMHAESAQREYVAETIKFKAEQQAGIPTVVIGGSGTDPILGMRGVSGYTKSGGGYIYAPTSGTQRMEGYITTGGSEDSGLITSGDSTEVSIGTPRYDAHKLDLGTGGIIPSHSLFEPAYKIKRLPD